MCPSRATVSACTLGTSFGSGGRGWWGQHCLVAPGFAAAAVLGVGSPGRRGRRPHLRVASRGAGPGAMWPRTSMPRSV